MQNARTIIENLLTKGKLEAAIEGSLILCRHYGDQERSSTAAQHSARYHGLMADYHAGTLHDDGYRPERARINRAMLDLAHSIPADWTDEALTQARFSASAYDKASATPRQKSFLEKWGLVLGLVASLMGILGITLREVIFPEKEIAPVQTADPKPDSTVPQQTEKPSVQEPKDANQSVKTPPVSSPSNKPGKLPKPARKPVDAPASTMETPDNTFRSFGKSVIRDDMERGKVGGKLAFRNVRTKQVLCCYAGAEDFSGGKAYVSKDGVQYHYINNKGERVE
ncbi:MAG: hypothetical protein ACKVUS_05350 [Saprospiraceae bacterium]